MNAKKRLEEFLDYKGISRYEFSKQTGISNGFFNSGDHISSKNLEIISKTYLDLNLIWLITGEGDKIHVPKVNLKNYSLNDVNSLEQLMREDHLDPDVLINQIFKSMSEVDFKLFIALIKEYINSKSEEVEMIKELLKSKDEVISSKNEIMALKDEMLKSKEDTIRKLKKHISE